MSRKFILLTFLTLALTGCKPEPAGLYLTIDYPTPEPTHVPLSDSERLLGYHEIGEVVVLGEHMISLVQTRFEEDRLEVAFVLQNVGMNVMEIRSPLNFTASQGLRLLDRDTEDCDSLENVRLLPGDFVLGKICWRDAEPGVKIFYQESTELATFNENVLIWKIQEDEVRAIPLARSPIQENAIAGETFSLPDRQVTLISHIYDGSDLFLDFLIENTGDKPFYINSAADIIVRNSSYETLPQVLGDCFPPLEGFVAPGDRIRGLVCLENANYGTLVFYDPQIAVASDTPIWKLVSSNETPDPALIATTVEGHQAYEIMNAGDHNIILSQITISNSMAKAVFIVENTSQQEIDISQSLVFSARNSDGRTLIEDEACSSGFDGLIPARSTRQFSVCWSGAKPDFRIYYLNPTFDTPYVLWIVE